LYLGASVRRQYERELFGAFSGVYAASKSLGVHLHRNLNQKHCVFALKIAPATAVKLLDSIALSHIWMGHFLHAKAGQYWMQINIHRTWRRQTA